MRCGGDGGSGECGIRDATCGSGRDPVSPKRRHGGQALIFSLECQAICLVGLIGGCIGRCGPVSRRVSAAEIVVGPRGGGRRRCRWRCVP